MSQRRPRAEGVVGVRMRLAALAASVLLASGCGPQMIPLSWVSLRINQIFVATSIPPIYYFNVTVTSHAGATGATMDPNNFRLIIGSTAYLPRIPSPPGPDECTASMSVPLNGSATCDASFVVTGPGVAGTLEYRNPSPAYFATASWQMP